MNNSSMACFEQGSGPPIVFVHGNASSHATWQPTVEHLKDRYRCITYDLRGHGASEPSHGSYSMDRLIDDLESVRVHCGLGRMRLVGHSLGAMIATEYALRFPELVERLCLLAMPANRSARDREAGMAVIRDVREQGLRGAMSGLAARWYSDAFVATHPGILERRLEQVIGTDEDVFIAAYLLYLETELGPRLKDISTPTLVMTGEHATGCGSDTVRFIARQVPDAKLYVFADMKNGVLTEIPDRVAEKIGAFLSSRPVSQSPLSS